MSVRNVVGVTGRCLGRGLFFGFDGPEVEDDAVFAFGAGEAGGEGVELLGIDAEEDSAVFGGEGPADVAGAIAFFTSGVDVFADFDAEVVPCVS